MLICTPDDWPLSVSPPPGSVLGVSPGADPSPGSGVGSAGSGVDDGGSSVGAGELVGGTAVSVGMGEDSVVWQLSALSSHGSGVGSIGAAVGLGWGWAVRWAGPRAHGVGKDRPWGRRLPWTP